MKESTAFEEMYEGTRGRWDSVKKSEEYESLLEQFKTIFSELEKKLEEYPELNDLVRETIDAMGLMHSEEIACYYKEGFYFGLKLGMEAASE